MTVTFSEFEFAQELCSLLPYRLRGGAFNYEFNGPQTTKHLIEALGIPHTEIGQLRVNGQPGSIDHRVQDGDFIQVNSVFPVDLLQGGKTAEPIFVLDGHLGRLAAYLRMLGLDSLYRNDFSDPELVKISVDEGRILLTRDRRLLMHKVVQQGCLVRSLEPEEQLAQIIQRFAVKRWVRPFKRCLNCNHELQPVSKAEVVERLEQLTRLYFNEFRQCPGCGQVYWKGSHYDRMLQMIQNTGLLSEADRDEQPPLNTP